MEITYQKITNITYNHIIEKIEHLTFPPIRKKVQTMRLNEPFTGIIATSNKQFLGAAFSDQPSTRPAELFSFFVSPEVRNQGIGTKILQHLESALKEQGITIIQSRYRSDWKSKEIIKKLLNRNEWEEPHLIRNIVYMDIINVPKLAWPKVGLPNHYSIEKWEELSEYEAKQIHDLLESKQTPQPFNPFRHADRIYTRASAYLKHENKVIGWNIVYRLNETTLEYNNLFLLEEYRRMGYAISLIYHSSHIQYKDKIPEGTWIVNANNAVMHKFTNHVIGDYVNKLIEVWGSKKNL